MNPLMLPVALLLALMFVITFGLTWWIRGRGFGELMELFGLRRKGPRP